MNVTNKVSMLVIVTFLNLSAVVYSLYFAVCSFDLRFLRIVCVADCLAFFN